MKCIFLLNLSVNRLLSRLNLIYFRPLFNICYIESFFTLIRTIIKKLFKKQKKTHKHLSLLKIFYKLLK